jgi:ubiquitin-like-conjugating enzyme ATG10
MLPTLILLKDHPITNSPAFFIHPCQTAAVLDASIANQDLSPLKYLTLWIGAMGNCVGLNIPSTLAQNI